MEILAHTHTHTQTHTHTHTQTQTHTHTHTSTHNVNLFQDLTVKTNMMQTRLSQLGSRLDQINSSKIDTQQAYQNDETVRKY